MVMLRLCVTQSPSQGPTIYQFKGNVIAFTLTA